MSKRRASRNIKAKYRREAVAARRIGEGKECQCGEARTRALIPGSDPMICAKCARRKSKKSAFDNHHVAGEANSSTTLPIPVNDHRAELSESQHDWPKQTLENPTGSPLLSGAAHIRGFADTVVYLIETFLRWIADMLEFLDTLLEQKWGQKWWRGTNLGSFEPDA